MRHANSTVQPERDSACARLSHDPVTIHTRVPTAHMREDVAQRAQEFIRIHLHEGLTLKDLAQFLGYSDKYCSDLFKALTGMPFSHYLKRLRLERAVSLLTESNATLSCIAESLGFSDQFTFSHFFKNAVGCSPQRFRSQCPARQLRPKPPRSAWARRRSAPHERR